MKLGPGLSFSWKRALGVTKAKRRVSKKTGIPLSRGGRRMKLGKWMGRHFANRSFNSLVQFDRRIEKDEGWSVTQLGRNFSKVSN